MKLFPFRRHKRPKTYRLNRLATRLENFLLSVWSKKLVLVTFTLLFVTGYYLNNFLVGIPEELFETAEERELRVAQLFQDVDKLKDTSHKITSAVHSLHSTLTSFDEVGRAIVKVPSAGGKSSYLVHTDIIQTFLAKLKNTRYELISAIAAVKTSTFQTSEYVDWYKGFEEDLRTVDTLLANLENAFQPILNSDLSDLASATKRLDDGMMKSQEAVEVLDQRTSFNILRLENANKRLDLLQSRKDFGETALAVRTLILLLLIALTIFCAILTYKLRNRKPPPFPMTQAQFDISRSQREKYQAMRAAHRTGKK